METGMDVTVSKKKKQPAKKGKQKPKGTVVEPRESFFRLFICSCEKGKELPEQIAELPDFNEKPELALEQLLEEVGHVFQELKDFIIPFAVRWYTGEAAQDYEDDDEDEEEESEDEDDDDSDEEDTPKGKKGAKKGAKGKPAAGAEGNPKQEECKQQ